MSIPIRFFYPRLSSRWGNLDRLLIGALFLSVLAGCQQTTPTRATDAAVGAAGAGAVAAAADGSDEPLPWPPPNGDIPEPQEAAAVGKLFEWSGDNRSLTRIVVDTDQQQARFYHGRDLLGWSTVATGTSRHSTPRGEFEVIEKVANKRSNLYGRIYAADGKLVKRNAKFGTDPIPPGGRFVGAKMPHFLRITYDGVGLHAGPIPRPGSPASHGCIRMPAAVANKLFNRVTTGTEVAIIGSQGPDYGDYSERVRASQSSVQRRPDASDMPRTEVAAVDTTDTELAALSGPSADPRPAPAGKIVPSPSAAEAVGSPSAPTPESRIRTGSLSFGPSAPRVIAEADAQRSPQ